MAAKLLEFIPIREGAGFVTGFRAALSGVGLLRRHREIRRLAAIPVVISLVVSLILGALYLAYFDMLRDAVWTYPDLDAWYGVFLRAAWFGFTLLFAVLSLIVFLLAFLVAGTLLSSAFHDALAVATLRLLGADLPETGDNVFDIIRDSGRTVVEELKKLGILLCVQIPVLLLLLAPGIGAALSSLAGLLVAWWFFALNFLDYPMQRAGYGFTEKTRWLRRHPGLSLGFGMGVNLLLFVPFLNLLTLPACVAAATALHHRLSQAEHDESSHAAQ